MATELDLLIDYYLWEKQRIESSIEQHKADEDYLALYQDTRALRQIENELTPLLTLQNPNYPEIKRKEHFKRLWQNRSMEEWETEEFFQQYQSREIGKLERELKRLRRPTPSNHKETQHFDEALDYLLQNHHQGIRIHFNKRGSFYLHIELQEKNIVLLKLFSRDMRDLKMLKTKPIIKELQFDLNEEDAYLFKEVSVSRNQHILDLKEVLSRLCFGLGDYLGIRQQIYLEFY